MRMFPSEREVRRAEARMGRRLFGAMAIVAFVFGLALIGRYLLGWW